MTTREQELANGGSVQCAKCFTVGDGRSFSPPYEVCDNCLPNDAAIVGGDPDCEHNWMLVETGYERQWSIRFIADEKVIVAYYGGSEDFSDEGAGDDHLRCATCLIEKPIPEGWEVDYS